MTWSQSSVVMSASLAIGKMPALAQRMSRPPWRSTAAAAMAAMSAGLVTSAAKPEAPWPSSAAVASASAPVRATTSTFAPWRANTRAMPLPMPLEAPVTMTERPAMEVSMVSQFSDQWRADRRRTAPAASSRAAAASTVKVPSVGTIGV